MLDLFIGNDAALLQIHQQHFAGLQPAFITNLLGFTGSTPVSEARIS